MLIGNAFSPLESLSLAMFIRSDRENGGNLVVYICISPFKEFLGWGVKQLGAPHPNGYTTHFPGFIFFHPKGSSWQQIWSGGPFWSKGECGKSQFEEDTKVGSYLEVHPRTCKWLISTVVRKSAN